MKSTINNLDKQERRGEAEREEGKWRRGS